MSIKHYFSKDADKRAKFIFNTIAPLYGKLDKQIQKGYKYSANDLDKEINLSGKSVLDIGTGTGAWIASLNKKNLSKAVGVDFSEKMLKQAIKNHPEITFEISNGEDLSKFEDNSFDVVTASFVLHGVKKDKRAKLLDEMKRISKKYVVLNDFIGKTPLFVRLLEFMEQSDYKNFKKNFCNELKEKFKNVRKLPAKYGSGIYIAEK
ncbi:MAG: class I SAM-dependent methyltransferase [Chlorobi bacterium]|nr:class I SAM-dependent methyltransferase [Chlorobiota bacterium]